MMMIFLPLLLLAPTASSFHTRLEIRGDNSLALLKIENILMKIVFYEYWKSDLKTLLAGRQQQLRDVRGDWGIG